MKLDNECINCQYLDKGNFCNNYLLPIKKCRQDCKDSFYEQYNSSEIYKECVMDAEQLLKDIGLVWWK